MRIALLEAFYSGSHKLWADNYQKYSAHQVELFTLPGKNWKWRMHGGAITLANQYLESGFDADLILASDMLDLSLFQGLTRVSTSEVKFAAYFHENQLTYPWSPHDSDVAQGFDLHYGFINFTSALSADWVYFNSEFHMQEFLTVTRNFLNKSRDFKEAGSVDEIEKKSSVLPVGLNLTELEKAEKRGIQFKEHLSCSAPIILWNHRWEHDKNPEGFLSLLDSLIAKGLDFNVVVLGEQPGHKQAEIDNAKSLLGSRVLHWGYADSREEYISWLWASDILPVTSLHDFFGISVIEAVFCNTLPILPKRLAYPEVFSSTIYRDCFYKDEKDLLAKVSQMLASYQSIDFKASSDELSRFSADRTAGQYDSEFMKLFKA